MADGMITTRRTALRLTLLGAGASALMLGGCSLFEPPPPPPDTGARTRARKPYRAADPKGFQPIINSYRAQNGLAPWGIDDRLTGIAALYARHMAEAGQMTHDLPPFGSLKKRLTDGGFAYLSAGENLGQGYRDMDDVFDGWHHSPGHDRGMRDPDATVFGIASVFRADDTYQAYWCLLFAKPR